MRILQPRLEILSHTIACFARRPAMFETGNASVILDAAGEAGRIADIRS